MADMRLLNANGQKAPTIEMESFWISADCPPPTHVDEWDDDDVHYCFDISDDVWICCADGTCMIGKYEGGSWYENGGKRVSDTKHIRVTHWMPLPKAPKEAKV